MTQEQQPNVDTTAEGAAPEAPVVEQAAAGELEQLRVRLAEVEAKAAENWDLALRTKAEADNIQRRARTDVENAHKFALSKFLQDLLPVVDSLELGLNAAQGSDNAVAKLREGVELTLKMLQDLLEKSGVKAINPVGQPFNPELHQAMSAQESAEHAPNTVMVVFQKGYTLNERLVRPALVVVSKASSQPAQNGGGVGQNFDQHA